MDNIERTWDALTAASQQRDRAERDFFSADQDWRRDNSNSNADRRKRTYQVLEQAAGEQRKRYETFRGELADAGLLDNNREGLRCYLGRLGRVLPGTQRTAIRYRITVSARAKCQLPVERQGTV